MNGKRMGGGRGQRRGIKKVGKIRGYGRKQETTRATRTRILSRVEIASAAFSDSLIAIAICVAKTINKCH